MAQPCIKKKLSSNAPVCRVHNERLEEHQSSEALSTSKLGDFAFLVCPVSGAVVDDNAIGIGGRVASPPPATPPDKRFRIRRFEKLRSAETGYP